VKLAIISAGHERFEEESSDGIPDSISGLIMGDFVNQSFRTHYSCDTRVGRSDPLFFLEHFLSGSDSGRIWLIEAWSGLGSDEHYRDFQRTSSLECSSGSSDSRSGRIIGDSTAGLISGPRRAGRGKIDDPGGSP
jgi:hypothetical protein